MQSITLEQIGFTLAFIVSLITSIEFLYIRFTRRFNQDIELVVQRELKVIREDINSIKSDVAILDEGQCKNYMSRFLKDKENGKQMDDVEEERFWEIYDHYSKPKENGGLGLNSYFHKKVEKLQKEGKL